MSPALERLLLVGCSVSVPIFSSIGAIRAGKAAAAAAAAAFFNRGQRLEVPESFLVCGRSGRHFEVSKKCLFFVRFWTRSVSAIVSASSASDSVQNEA